MSRQVPVPAAAGGAAPSRKRKCTEPLTPPLSASDAEATSILDKAVHVLSIEATALSHVSRLYQTDPTARDGLVQAVEAIVDAHEKRGKLIICGIGKSGLVGQKTVATMKSLGIRSSFLHAAEAVHGDLGDIHAEDVVLFITFSGKTPELLNLMAHIPADTTVMAMTSHSTAAACPLLADRKHTVLLPAPIHETEEASFGVCAPTTSTTVAIALGDMLAITAAEKLYEDKKRVFHRNHPGGAIGKRVKIDQLDITEE